MIQRFRTGPQSDFHGTDPSPVPYTGQPWLLRPRLSRFVTSPSSGYASRPNRVIDGRRTCTLQDSRPCWPLLAISNAPGVEKPVGRVKRGFAVATGCSASLWSHFRAGANAKVSAREEAGGGRHEPARRRTRLSTGGDGVGYRLRRRSNFATRPVLAVQRPWNPKANDLIFVGRSSPLTAPEAEGNPLLAECAALSSLSKRNEAPRLRTGAQSQFFSHWQGELARCRRMSTATAASMCWRERPLTRDFRGDPERRLMAELGRCIDNSAFRKPDIQRGFETEVRTASRTADRGRQPPVQRSKRNDRLRYARGINEGANFRVPT